MSTTIKTGWLNDKNGNKFAPKTLMSQVQTSDGVLIEDKINNDLNEIKIYIDSKDVFVATYDVTTYQEVVEAHNAGRIVQVRDTGGIIYPLCVCSEEEG